MSEYSHSHVFSRLERAKKLQEQREKEMVEKQKQQEMAAGNLCILISKE